MIYDEHYPYGAPHVLNPLSGWYYADSNNQYPIIDESRCYIACPNGSYIRIEHFYGEYDDFHPDCFHDYNNGIYVLIGLWNSQGPNAKLPDTEIELEELRLHGIDLLLGKNSDYNNIFLKYPLKLTSSIEKEYMELPPSKYSRWVEGDRDYSNMLTRIYSALSECYQKRSIGDTKYDKCKTCYCRFLGIPGNCRNSDFDAGITALREEQDREEMSHDIEIADNNEQAINELELSPYDNLDWLVNCGISDYKRLFASPIPKIDSIEDGGNA